jgi:hypothetical protein
MLFLAETKIDVTFTDTQFKVNDFHFWRAGRNQYGGGLVAYARSDLAGQWHLRLTKFYTIWLLYVYKMYSILKIQNITLDTEISWMYHR